MAINQHFASIDVQTLRQGVTGRVLTPGDPDYEQRRRGWNLAVNQYPALILIAADAEDVVAGVNFAREYGLGVAVQSTGHGIHYAGDDSLLIVTTEIASVEVDAEARTARVGAGVIWQQVLDVTTPLGLAPLLGSSPHVGVVGYSLGGGIGWLARRYGLAADSVRRVELVTADGVLRHASSTELSDLFWGVRGGGGNFGVVTALEFNLYPVATIYGGNLIYPAERIADALHFYRDWVQSVPDELTSSISIVRVPPLPEVPEPLRGKTVFVLRAVQVGDAAQGAALIRQWLDWQTPMVNTFAEMPFANIAAVSNDPVEPRPLHYSSELLDDLSDDAIDIITRFATDSASPLTINEIRHAGGAIARVAPDANAIGHRDAQFYLILVGAVPSQESRANLEAYIRRFKEALSPYLPGGVYLNFIRADEAAQRAQDAYLPESYARLLELKAKYDPANMFRFTYRLVAPPN